MKTLKTDRLVQEHAKTEDQPVRIRSVWTRLSGTLLASACAVAICSCGGDDSSGGGSSTGTSETRTYTATFAYTFTDTHSYRATTITADAVITIQNGSITAIITIRDSYIDDISITLNRELVPTPLNGASAAGTFTLTGTATEAHTTMTVTWTGTYDGDGIEGEATGTYTYNGSAQRAVSGWMQGTP